MSNSTLQPTVEPFRLECVETRDGWCDVLLRIGDRELKAVAGIMSSNHPIHMFLSQLATVDQIVEDNRPYGSAFSVGMSVDFNAEPGGHQLFCTVEAAQHSHTGIVSMQVFGVDGDERPFRKRPTDFDYPPVLSGHVAFEDFRAEIMRNAAEVLKRYGLTGLRTAWLANDWESRADDIFPLEAYLRLLGLEAPWPTDSEDRFSTARLLRDLHGLLESLKDEPDASAK